MKSKVDSIDETTRELNKNVISNNAVSGIKGKIAAVIITFIITVLAGLLVAFLQGWLTI